MDPRAEFTANAKSATRRDTATGTPLLNHNGYRHIAVKQENRSTK